MLSVLLRYTDSDYPLGIFKLFLLLKTIQRIGDVMVSVLASRAVDRGFEPRSDHTKDYKIGMCCYFAKHTSLRRKNKVILLFPRTGWLGIRIMCPSGATCLSADCYFRELVLYQPN